jgi:predicted transcriptional regulator
METLNIDYNIRELVLKALNKTQYRYEAAKLLGVSDRSLNRYMESYNIKYHKLRDVYYISEQIKTHKNVKELDSQNA